MEKRLFRQGDVLLIPTKLNRRKLSPVTRENGRLVLADGEATGHAHMIVDESAELVTADGAAELFLLVHGPGPVELVHEEHDTIQVPPGEYEVRRQREYAPEEIRLVAD